MTTETYRTRIYTHYVQSRDAGAGTGDAGRADAARALRCAS